MDKLALILSLAFASHVAVAQTNVPIGLDAERNLMELGNGTNATTVRTYDNRYEGVKGSPFFNEEWAKASITANNTRYENVDVKYNAREGNVLYRNPEGSEYILEARKIDQFVLKDNKTQREYTFKKVPVLASKEPSLLHGFAAVIYEGNNLQLLMVPKKNLVKANFKGPYTSGNTYDELQDEQVFYLIGPNQTVNKVKLNKKSLLKALSDKQNQVDKFIASERLDAGSDAGWAKALAYYETL
jgi:hypothetical protein